MAKLDLRKNEHPTGGREYKLPNLSRSIITPRSNRDKIQNFLFYKLFHLNLIPEPPSNLTASTVDETSVDVNWTASPDSVDSYTLFVKNQSSGTIEQTITGLVGTSTTAIGLTTGDTYEFWTVAAINLINSKPSNADTAVPQDITAPATPIGLTEDAVGTNSIDISWNVNSESDVSLYRIYVDGVEHVNSPVSHPTTTFTVDGLDPETSYDITISAEDTSGNESAQTSPLTSTTTSAAVAYETDFGEFPDGAFDFAANGWTEQWTGVTDSDTIDNFFDGFDADHSPDQGTKFLHSHAGANGEVLKVVDETLDLTGELLVLENFERRSAFSSGQQLFVGALCSGAHNNKTGYVLELNGFSTARIIKYVGNSATVLGSATLGTAVPSAFSNNNPVWFRLSVANNGDIKSSIWNYGETEPAWMIEVNDTDISTGKWGYGRNRIQRIFGDYYHFDEGGNILLPA